MPRRAGHLVNKLETGTFKVGVAPTDLSDFEHVLRSVANRIGGALIVAALLIASALLARVHDLLVRIRRLLRRVRPRALHALEDRQNAGGALSAEALDDD